MNRRPPISHRTDPPFPYTTLCRSVTWLSALRRVAIGLDRNHAARVDDVAVRHDDSDDGVALAVTPVAGQDVALELYAAGERTGPLEAVLGAPIRVLRERRRPDGSKIGRAAWREREGPYGEVSVDDVS